MATSTKPVTVGELKTFIDAVEFASDTDEWVPSPRQWKRIREMIERLEERAPAAAPAPVHQQQQPQMMVPMMVPSTMMPAPQHMPSAMAAVPPPGVPLAAGAPNVAVKTPDIDTSNGTYVSTFT